MRFYDCSTAPSPRRARMFIAEKGLSIDMEEVSLTERAQLSEAFLAINPRATVPVLVTDQGTVLTENIAIATYLEEVHPSPTLIGETPDQRAHVMMWNAIIEQQGLAPIADALRNGNPHMKGRALTGTTDFDQIPDLAMRGMQRTQLFFDMLDARLQEQAFVAGGVFSLADITAFVAVDFARVIKMRVSEETPGLAGWYARMKGRPSASL